MAQPPARHNTVMSELTDLLERFRRGPELVATVMTGAAGAELDWATEGKWSVRQVLAHLADAEIVIGDRLRRTIAEDNPTLQGYDQNAWAANLNYGKRKPSEALETLRRLRSETFDLLKDLPDSAFERTANHTERGRLTLKQIVESAAEHTESHARQVRSIRDQYKQMKVRAAS